jgi:RHS repeat-associated protein
MLARLLFIWVFLLSSAAFASGEVMYIHTDGLGSPVARSDKNGNLISGSRTRYEPYGATAAGATPTIGFTGHVNDANTGLVYMQQRYYDPHAGRFLSTDPVLTDANTGDSFNRYHYAKNNPYKYIDPDGRAVETPWDAFNVALGIGSMVNNLAKGNYGSAAIDAVGVAIDTAAAAAPFIPGGAATVINTSRVANAAGNVASSATNAVKLEKKLASEAQSATIMAGKGEKISGAGTETVLRDAPRLAKQHGGKAEDWSKVNGGNHVAKDGTKIETHGYENSKTGSIVELKTKLKDEGAP